MWPFGRPKTLRQIEVERFPELVNSIAQKWPVYLSSMENAGFSRPPLEFQFGTFGVKAAEALRKSHFALRRSEDVYFMLAVATGIVESGLYTTEEVEAASGFENLYLGLRQTRKT